MDVRNHLLTFLHMHRHATHATYTQDISADMNIGTHQA